MARYSLPLPTSTNPPLRGFCVYLPDDVEHLSIFLGAISRLANQNSWVRDDAHSAKILAQTWKDVVRQIEEGGFVPCGPDCPPEENQPIKVDSIYYLLQYEEEEEEEDDMRPEVEKINGVWYIVVPCGPDCGQHTYIPIGSATSVEPGVPGADMDTDKTMGTSATLETVTTEQERATSAYIDCYSTKAATYLLQRMKEYTFTMRGLGTTFFDLPADNEVFDTVLIIDDLLRGGDGLQSTQGLQDSLINSTFSDSALIAAAASHWHALEYRATVSKRQLRAWINKLPLMWGLFPLRAVALSWISYSLIRGYNQDLARFAVECVTGNTLPESLQYTVVDDTSTYKVTRVTLPQRMTQDLDIAVGIFTNVAGLAIEGAKSITETGGNNYIGVGLTANAANQWKQWGVPDPAALAPVYSVKHPLAYINCSTIFPSFNFTNGAEATDIRTGTVYLNFNHAAGNTTDSGTISVIVIEEK